MAPKFKRRHGALWLDNSIYPTNIAFVPTEKSWNAIKKHLEIETEYPTSDAACTHINHSDGHWYVLVTVADCATDQEDQTTVVAALCHESVHVWQNIKLQIGEDAPGREAEAYAIEWIFSGMMHAYAQTRMGA